MAKLYPSVRPAGSEKVSDAELAVYDALAVTEDDWLIIHSLWLKSHSRKLHAEADFILITDNAVLIIEVKGGDVWRDHDGWHFRPRSGRGENVKREGPFEQAMGAYYALRKHLADCGHVDLFDDHVWGYGVICPDCVLDIPGRDASVDPCMLLDAAGFPQGLKSYIATLTDYWRGRYAAGSVPGVGARRQRSSTITPTLRQELLRYLRPEFELVTGLGAESARVEQELLKLTATQLIALDFMELESRNMLIGPAGTGKTILVAEQARRKAAEGEKVLVLCFNKLLGRKIASGFEDDGRSLIDVGSYYQFVMGLCRKAGLEIPITESWDGFCAELKAISADLIGSLGPDELYDYVLIDEGQDLMNDEFMELVGCLLKGGLEQGRWLIACDIRQAIFRDNFNMQYYDYLSSHSRRTSLQLNCRNTRQIAAYVSGVSGEGETRTRGVNGEVPVFRYFSGKDQYLKVLKKVVNELIHSFVETGLPLQDIVILYANRESVPEEVMKPGFFLRSVIPFEQAGGADAVRITSIQSYKGLEAKAVVLLGINEFSSGMSRGLFYVGASRARTNLRVLLPDECGHLESVLPAILRLLDDGAAMAAE
jgi:hypothetical protein